MIPQEYHELFQLLGFILILILSALAMLLEYKLTDEAEDET